MKDKGEVSKVKGQITKKKVEAKTLAGSTGGTGRARAWLFLLVSSTDEVTERLSRDRTFERGGNEYVIVRADVVKRSKDFPYNLVIPIDAADEDTLNQRVESLLRLAEPTGHAVALVREHVPFPPHDAHGFITEEEAEQGDEPIEKPGRQGASPGENPWG